MNIKQHTFVTEYLRFGDKIIAYKNAYKCKSTSYRTMESSANRLLNNPEVALAIKHAQDTIRREVEQEIKAELKRELLTIQRKREILASIAEGDIYIEQQYKGKNCSTCTQLIKPTINQMLKAIDLDNKLSGDYTSKKQLTVIHANKTEAVSEEPAVEVSSSGKIISHAGLRKMLSPEKRNNSQQNKSVTLDGSNSGLVTKTRSPQHNTT